jgi:hypothetical protein
MGSLTDARERLDAAWKSLQERWRDTSVVWKDAISRRFERDFWQEFERQVPPTLEEMQKLAGVIAQARRQVR